jgi:hypothetical protein
MASPLSGPQTTEQMIQQEIKERDLMMTRSVQALAMDRLRASIRSLSRETGFQSRPPIEQFSQAPLYIPNPEYMKWSNTLGKLVGTPAPTMMNIQQALDSGFAKVRGPSTVRYGYSGGNLPTTYTYPSYEIGGRIYQEWQTGAINKRLREDYQRRYKAWQEAQRMLPS